MTCVKKANNTTLLSRVRQHVLWLNLALFLWFSLTTIFIVFALEDAIFKEQLQHNYQLYTQGGTLPADYKLIKQPESFQLTPREQLKYFEFDDDFGEFKDGDKHFHFMKTDNGVLLFDSTQRGIFSRVIDDILLLLLIILLPSLALTYYVSTKLSVKALKPFYQVYQAIENEQYQETEIKNVINDIKEQDIKSLAIKLVSALEQKAIMLEQQIVFNQGMAHEIRTPLQVMSHSIELMQATSEEIAKTPAFNRLEKSIIRVHRISTALLWLTSNSNEAHQTDVITVAESVLEESQVLIEKQSLEVKINKNAHLYLPLPEVVLELIIFNLLTNVIHHCHSTSEQKCWYININKSSVSFSNPIQHHTKQETSESRFGLGLLLVQRLAQKFDLTFSTSNKNNVFNVTLNKEGTT